MLPPSAPTERRSARRPHHANPSFLPLRLSSDAPPIATIYSPPHPFASYISFLCLSSIYGAIPEEGKLHIQFVGIDNTISMHDPIPGIPWLAEAVTPFANLTGLTTLPLHIHEVAASFLAYTFINKIVAPRASTYFFPQKYPALSAEKRFNWDVHVVSLCQSLLVNSVALWVLFFDEERKNMSWEERVWGYTGASGCIQGLAAGYFLWDLVITLQNIKMFGPGMLADRKSVV